MQYMSLISFSIMVYLNMSLLKRFDKLSKEYLELMSKEHELTIENIDLRFKLIRKDSEIDELKQQQ